MSSTEKLIETISQVSEGVEPGPTPYGIFLRWMGGSAVYIAIMVFISEIRPDIIACLHNYLYRAEIVSLLAVLLTSGLSASLLSYPDIYQRKYLLYLPLIALAAFFYVLYLEWQMEAPDTPDPGHGFQCLFCITLFSTFSIIWLTIVLRKQAVTHYYAAGLAVFLASYSIGCLTLRLTEAVDSVSHLVEWHYLPMLGFSLIGVVIGKKLLRW